MKEDKQSNKLLFAVRQNKAKAEQIEYKIVSDHKINLTQDLAYRFLEMKTFTGERAVNENHVQHLYDEWCQGRFMWEQCTIGICRVGDVAYRVNGQHTCWLRANITDKDVDCTVRELVYKVPDEHNLRLLYSTFDQGKSRSQSHNFKVMMMGKSSTQEINPSVLSHLANGIKMWLWEDRKRERTKVTASELSILISEQYSKLFQMVGLYFQARYPNYVAVKRAAAIGAMFATYNASPAKAKEFWDAIIDGLGFTGKTDARYLLRKFMDTHGHHISEGSTAVTQEEMYRICVQAWNRWRNGEEVSALRSTDKRVKAI